jgi:Family of unknown function (DUF6163)
MRFSGQTEARLSQAAAPGDFIVMLVTRAVGVVALALAVAAMARIIGIGGFDPGRFDLMPVEWRFAATVLVVMNAASGLGLWSVARWGVIVWLMTGLFQIGMHTARADLFGPNTALIVLICASYLALLLVNYYAYSVKARALVVR